MTILDVQLVSDGTEVELPFNRKKLPTEPGSSETTMFGQGEESVLVKRRKKCLHVSMYLINAFLSPSSFLSSHRDNVESVPCM